MRIPEVLDLLDMKSEVLWWAVAHREVWADLEFELLRDGDMCSVHSSRSRMVASRERQSPVSDAAISLRLNRVELEPGSRLSMNEKPYVVVVRSPDQVWLREDKEGSNKFAISLDDVKEFLSMGVITGVQSKDVDDIYRKRSELLARASDKELAKAVTRLKWVEEYRETGKKPAGISLRSLRRYEADFRKGQQVYGSGFFGLIGERGRPPGKSDLGERQQEVLKEIVDDFVGDKSAGHLRNTYARMKARCEKRRIFPIPCRETLRNELEKRRKDDVARGRKGEREATQVSGPLMTGDPVIPRKADRVWQVAHVDHLLVKVELVSWHDEIPLGKAWLTLIIDDFSRMPLGMWLSFDEPSRVPVFRVLFDCVRRHNRLPEYVVTDQGPEFHSRDVEAAFAGLEVNRVERPGGKPRFGSVIERMFGSTNTRLVHELPGNVKRNQLSRTRSRSHDPKRNATLSLSRLNEILEEWLFDIYPNLVHESFGQTTPRQVYGTSLAYSGERKARYIAVDMGLRMALSLTPDRPTREVGEGGVIRVEGLRYHSEALLAGNVVGSKVQVKLCAEDCSVVYVWVGRKWVTCRLSDGNAEWAGRSRKEMKLLIETVRQKYRLGRKAFDLNAATIGGHLEELDVGGKAARQAVRDEEVRTISGNGLSEGDGCLHEEQVLEVSPAKSDDVSGDKVPEGLDPDDVLASARPLKVVRR